MILSVSRRTDIPAFYSDWFLNRLKDGFVCVRNPMFKEKVSKISLDKEVIDCIVFWTKNPGPMLNRLNELDGYNYYFQYTINAYGPEIEPVLGMHLDDSIETFLKLSKRIGNERIIWRYDPIFLSETYTKDFHVQHFKKIAESLNGKTNRVVISFLDLYEQTKKNMPDIEPFNEDAYRDLARSLAVIAHENGMIMESCAEIFDLSSEGINHGHCIDKVLIEKIIGYQLTGNKDKSQRQECGCMESIDIGTYNTCKNGCRYCYATYGKETADKNIKRYDAMSPFLCDTYSTIDVISERKMRSLKRKK